MTLGHCLCGQLKFSTSAEPNWIAYCHCASCRRHTASPVSCFVNYKVADVTFTGKRSVYGSSSDVRRSYCASCGTPVAYEVDKRADEIDIYLNVLDEPEKFPPQGHAYFHEHIDWFDTKDDLPRE